MRRVLLRLREETMGEFNEHCYGEKQEEFRKKLKLWLEEKEADILAANNNITRAKNN